MRSQLVAAYLLLSIAQSSSATTYVVRPDGTGDYPTIQAAVNAATGGDTIALTDGVFTGDGNRDVDLLGKAITIRSQGGDPEACIIESGGHAGEEHRGFIMRNQETADTILTGLTVRGGYVMDGWPPASGAGCHCEGTASPTIRDCIFAENEAAGGGAIGSESSQSEVLRCRFIGNVANGGGAVWGVAKIRDCSFIANQAEDGGAVMSASVVTGCVFTDNHTLDWGSAISGVDSVSGCVFERNVGAGGAVYALNRPGVIVDCSFTDNLGGGVFWEGRPLSVSDCEFINNDIGLKLQECEAMVRDVVFAGNVNAQKPGGGISSDGSGLVTDCLFLDNTARHGGGVYCSDGGIDLVDCTFIRNRATSGTGGGAISGWNADFTTEGCTFIQNSAASGNGIGLIEFGSATLHRSIFSFGTMGTAISCAPSGNITLTCCDIYGNTGGDWVGCIADQYGQNGNISEDPLFCDMAGENYTLHADSPCAPEHSGGCGLIGAQPVGCGVTTVVPTTWGGVKKAYK